MTQVLEQVAEKLTARKKNAEADYRKYARQIAEGKEPPADKLSEVMNETGKSVDDIRKFVAVYHRRKAIVDALARVPSLTQEKSQLEAICNDADRKRDEALRIHAETVAAPVERLQQVRVGLDSVDSLSADLLLSCPYPDVKEAYEQAFVHANNLYTESTKLLPKIQELPKEILRARASITKDWSGTDRYGVDQEQNAKRYERELAEIQARLPVLEIELAEARSIADQWAAKMREL